MSSNYQSSWYRFFFPRRARIIHDYLAAQKTQWAAWGARTVTNYDHSFPTPNGIQILLDVGAANLSPRAFRDICWHIIDEVKIGGSVPSYLDPNPLHPMLKDENLLPFLRHCQKHKLCVTPLYNASFEAGMFLSKLPSICEIPVQVNGHLVVVLKVPVNITQADLETTVINSNAVFPYVQDKTIKKLVVIPHKLVNIVTD